MAKQIIHKLVDDLDGGDADETVKFALDGVQYEIDLSTKNAAKLRDVFAPYVARRHQGRPRRRGRRRPGGARPGRRRRRPRAEQGDPGVGQEGGKDISDRGRIPQEIVDEYHAKAGR